MERGEQTEAGIDWLRKYLNQPIEGNDPPEALARMRATVDRLALAHGLAWVCGDLATLSAQATTPVPPALPPGESMASTTLWTLRWPESGALRERALGWSHPHGRWVGGWRGDVNGCEAGPA